MTDEEEFDLKYEYKYLVKQEKLTKSLLDSTQEVIRSREDFEDTVSKCLEEAKENNDSFGIKRFSRELNDLREAKEPEEKEIAEYKESLLNIYDQQDEVLKKLEQSSVDLVQLKYTVKFLGEE